MIVIKMREVLRETNYTRISNSYCKSIYKERWMYIMLIPGIIYFLLFKYGPMFGLVMAFENYQPYLGFINSEWVGFEHFIRFFNEPAFWLLFKNTLILAILNVVFFFPTPILLSLLLNEIHITWFKRLSQTLIYIPHFLSWVVIAAITYTFMTVDGGIVNNYLTSNGLESISVLTNPTAFRPMILIQVIWKEAGWGTIIFLAAITGIDPELYSAADVDGAGRLRKLWHITLPGIRSTIIIMLILRMGAFLNTGFEQLLLMVNALNREVGEVFDTYVYTVGVQQGQFSYTAAVGFFKSFVSLLLIISTNNLAKMFGEEGIY
ncbi:ABC transporter permease [Vallitalea okinawensis]|uniref:ABC transporter permease n=1 Tax=Vallitalea okinawensis TaxID=2078660 RepID=UPI001A9A6CCD|nr:ABC transporter permease subunit [Vallitalea okinawensis]